MTLRSLPLLLVALCPLSAAADDRPELATGECHPPVLPTFDGDWRSEAGRLRSETLKTLLRYVEGEAAARAQLRAALRVAETTRMSAFDVLQLTRELLLRGVRPAELEPYRAAVVDMQATQGPEPASRFLRALVGLRGRALATAEELRDLDELVGKAAIRDAAGRRLALKGDEAAVREQVNGRLRGEGIEGSVLAAAVLEALLRQLSQREPGAAARAALSACIEKMARACPRREAEEHCRSTPREYLDLLKKDL
jgi:hypothetical protein